MHIAQLAQKQNEEIFSFSFQEIRGSLCWVLFYFLSISIYELFLGLKFQSEALEYLTQYLPLSILKSDLAGAIWNLHSQPPLMNLIIGISIAASPENYALILKIFFILMGAVGVFFTHRTLVLFQTSSAFVTLLMLSLVATPSLMLFVHWPYTTLLEFCFCSIMTYGLIKFTRSAHSSLTYLILIMSSFCLLSLLRAQWHFSLGILLIVLLVKTFPYGQRLRAFSYSICCLLPLFAVCAKNQFLFNEFTTSTWLGFNISSIVVQTVNPEEIDTLISEGVITKNGFYFPLTKMPESSDHTSRHPSLMPYFPNGKINYNAYNIIDYGKEDFRNALAVIHHYPKRFFGWVFDRYLSMSYTPSAAHTCCGFDFRNITLLNTPYYELPSFVRGLYFAFSLITFLAAPILLVLLLLFEFIFSPAQKSQSLALTAKVFVLLIIFLNTTAFALNAGEQERMRWGWTTISLAQLALCYEWLVHNYHARLKKNR